MDTTEPTISGASAPTGSADRAVPGRRRFLKGTGLALPAVVTLHATPALATVRSSLTCIETVPQQCKHITDYPDDYLREKCKVYDRLKKNSKGKWVRDNKETFFEGIRSSDQKRCWRWVETGEEVTDPNVIKEINCYKVNGDKCDPKYDSPLCEKYAIVRCSKIDGSVVSVGDKYGKPGTIVVSMTGACLLSIYGRHHT